MTHRHAPIVFDFDKPRAIHLQMYGRALRPIKETKMAKQLIITQLATGFIIETKEVVPFQQSQQIQPGMLSPPPPSPWQVPPVHAMSSLMNVGDFTNEYFKPNEPATLYKGTHEDAMKYAQRLDAKSCQVFLNDWTKGNLANWPEFQDEL